MTIEQFNAKLEAKIRKIKSGLFVQLAAADAHDAMSERIFEDNQNVSGQTFQYATSTKIKKNKKGRFTPRVSFKDTGELQSDFNNSTFGKPTPTKIDNFAYKINLRRDRDVKVREKLDEKYDRVFRIRESEKKVFLESAEKNLKLILFT